MNEQGVKGENCMNGDAKRHLYSKRLKAKIGGSAEMMNTEVDYGSLPRWYGCLGRMGSYCSPCFVNTKCCECECFGSA